MKTNGDRTNLEKIIYQIFFNEELEHIFKDLIWGIIRFKENKNSDSIKNLGEFCEHSHKVLFYNLEILSPKEINLMHFPETRDWEINEKLQNEIFMPLSINNRGLLKLTREIVKKWNNAKHEYEKGKYPIFKSDEILSECITSIKLFLILITLFKIQEKNQNINRLDLIKKIQNLQKIDHEFVSLFNQSNDEIIDYFLDIIFSRNIRNLLFKRSILDPNDILNSTVLQNFLPHYIFNIWRIEDQLLNDKIIYPFRSTGPKIIDYEKGNWIFIPKIAKYIFKLLKNRKKSVILRANSGTGKTVISRWIGYKYYNERYKVYYIDCLQRRFKELDTVVEQIMRLNHGEGGVKKLLDTLFIFENIHVLDNELKKKINKCKDTTLCLLTERIFEEKQKEQEKEKGINIQNFDFFQIFTISMNHWTFRNTINGMLNINCRNPLILKQLQYIGNQNLWIYAILLKLFKESFKIKQDSSIIDILVNHNLIRGKISEYFRTLLKSENEIIQVKSSEDTHYLNHITYFLGILSIFSKYEIWTETKFFDSLISIRDESPLGKLNSDINIDKDILKEIQAFLFDLFEISERNIDFRPGIKDKEYKIPHSQMAIIYTNCILKLYDNIYPGLINQLFFHYISFGKYYGSFLQQKYLYFIREGDFKDFREIDKKFFDFEAYFKSNNYVKKIQNQIIKNTIEENNLFFDYLSAFDNELDDVIFKKVFHTELIIFNPLWKFKIMEGNSNSLFYFLDMIYNFLEENVFFEFLRNFKEEIFKKFKEDKGDYIFSFLNLLLPLNDNLWLEFLNDISELIDHLSIDIKNLFVVYNRNKSFFCNLTKEHLFYSMVKKVMKNLILRINFEDERGFVPSLYYNYDELFSQIYYEVLEELFSQNDLALNMSYNKKLHNTNLIIIINYLKDLYEDNSYIAIRFFKKFVDVIKKKLYHADVNNIETFFDVLSNIFKKEKNLLKNTLLTDWDWFVGIFLRFSSSEFYLLSRFKIINWFLENHFPEYLENYNKFFINVSKQRIQEDYEKMESGLDIVDNINFIGFVDEIREFILNLFNKSIYHTLKTQSLTFYIDTFLELKHSNYVKKNWDFRTFVLSKEFKAKLIQAKDTVLKEFFNVFWKGTQWREILIENYKELIINRFGQDFEIIMKLDEKRLEFISNLHNLDIVEMIKLYYYYCDPFFNRKDSYFFLQLRKSVQENYDKIFNAEFTNQLSSLDFTDFFNLIIILKAYHPSILKEFCTRNQLIILDILNQLNDECDEFLDVLMILEFFQLKLNILEELDDILDGDFSLNEAVLKKLKKIDLATLRYLIQTNPAGFLKELTKISLLNHMENSSLLQLSIFLYKGGLDVELKIPGHFYLRNFSLIGGPVQKSQFVLELSEKDFQEIKKKMKSLLWIEGPVLNPKRKGISYSHHSGLLTKIISEQFTPFFPTIIDLIKQSNIWEIALFFKSLTNLFTEIDLKKLEIPEKLEKYLISEEFKRKINNAEFYDIYRFFKYLKMINFSLSREIWMRNRIIFEDEVFTHILRNDYIYRIFNFYDMYNNEHFKFGLESIEILKKIIRSRPLETTIRYFLEVLSNDDFNALISVFKEDIMDIAKKYSKIELKNILSKNLMRKYNTDSLLMIRTFFQERLNEKYFFES